MSSDRFEKHNHAETGFKDPVFLQYAEATVSPWWGARIHKLIKQNQTDEASSLFKEFDISGQRFKL